MEENKTAETTTQTAKSELPFDWQDLCTQERTKMLTIRKIVDAPLIPAADKLTAISVIARLHSLF